MAPNLHDHAMCIKPIELAKHLRASGLEPGPVVGIGLGVTTASDCAHARHVPAGDLTYGELGHALRMRELRSTSAF
jgi:hypothetical protein